MGRPRQRIKYVVKVNNKDCGGDLLACPENTDIISEDYDQQLEAISKEMDNLRRRINDLRIKKRQLQLAKAKNRNISLVK